MSSVTDITQLQNSNTSLAGSGTKDLGQEAFLTLMTTQLRNQDPFEPMDNGEFLSQIAQFGTVNGITDLKDSFQGFAASMQSNQALQAASLIGHNVLVNSDYGTLANNGSISGAVELDGYASNVAVNIYDATGQLVNRFESGEQFAGTIPFSWDGSTFNGAQAPAGSYRFEIEVLNGDQTIIYPTLLQGNVNSLAFGAVGEEMQVEVQGLGTVSFSDITKIL